MDRAGRSPLHYAALENNLSEVQRLVASGLDLNLQDRMGMTPLHFAVQQYSVAAAKELLDQGAQVDIEDRDGNTPLLRAAFDANGRGEIIALLRAHGADPHRENPDGFTPVSVAKLVANYDNVQFFQDLLP